MAVGQRKYPYLSFRFAVEIQQLVVGGFNEVAGLTFETEVETFRQGGENLHERQLAGPTKFPSRLILKRGVGDMDDLWSWYQNVTTGKIERKNIAILLLDSSGREKRRWRFREACPVKWTGPEFRAGTAEVAFETIELVHHGFLSI